MSRAGQEKKKRHPLLLALDIVIVVLTISLALVALAMVIDIRERASWRNSPSSCSWYLQEGDYQGLFLNFYGSSDVFDEAAIPEAVRPFAAVAAYYKDAFLSGIYGEMGDEQRKDRVKEAMDQDREAMGIYRPEAAKIDKIFDIGG